MLVSILFTISSIYLIKDLLLPHRFANQASAIISFTSLLWWVINLSDAFDPFIFQASVSVTSGILYFLFILSVDEMRFMSNRLRSVALILAFLHWVFQLYCVGYVYFFNVFLLPDVVLQLLSLTFGVLLFLGIKTSKYSIHRTRIFGKIRFETVFILTYLGILSYLFFIHHDYMAAPRFLFFYLMYFSFFGPYFLLQPLKTLRLYVQSLIFTVLFLILAVFMYGFLSFIGFPEIQTPYQWLFYAFSSLAVIVFLSIFDHIILRLDKLYPFSILRISEFHLLMQQLKGSVQQSQIKTLISSIRIFKSQHHRIHLWDVRNPHFSEPITQETPALAADITMFLQYKETIHFEEIQVLLNRYSQTPLNVNVRSLFNFMLKHSIARISLLQKSRETVGVFAVSLQK